MPSLGGGRIAAMLLVLVVAGGASSCDFRRLVPPDESRLRQGGACNDVRIRAYLRNDADGAEIAAVRLRIEALAADGRIASFAFITREAALERIRERLGEDSPILDLALGNPLPDSFEITAAGSADVAVVVADLGGMPGLQASTPGQLNPDSGSSALPRTAGGRCR